IDKGEQVHTLEAARAIAIQPTTVLPEHEEETAEDLADDEAEEEAEDEAEPMDEEPPADNMQSEPREPDAGDPARPRRPGGSPGGRRESGEPPYEAPRPEQGAFAGQQSDERAGEDYGYAPREAAGGEGYGDGARRRRRGRRGGRRRRGREGEPFEAAPSFDAELDSAVADFDRPSTAHRAA